jgi:hypothetical protein
MLDVLHTISPFKQFILDFGKKKKKKKKEEKEARKPLRPTNNQKAKKHSRNCIQIR